MRRLIFGLLLVAGACGQPQAQPPISPLAVASPIATATAAPSPSSPPTPTKSAALLFAALEAKGTVNFEQWNTVAIAGLDGYARAKTTFVPMRVPSLGCQGAKLPPSAHVAAGSVYFADGTGVVRSLSAQGQITRVATFPLTSGQQMLSFAVSPDGSRLLGAVFTVPPKPQLLCGDTPVVAGYSLDVYSAAVGGASTLLYNESLPAHLAENRIDNGINVMAFVGWDQLGPIATYPAQWVHNQGGPGRPYIHNAVRVDPASGKVFKQVSSGTCDVHDIALTGDFVCSLAVNVGLSVRRPDGSEIWRGASKTKNGMPYSYLSPDERRLVVGDGAVMGQDGSQVVLVEGFAPVGWLDSTTVIGVNYVVGNANMYNLSFVGLSAPGTMVDIGFKGQFVGVIRT
jgi:hypothetical protein